MTTDTQSAPTDAEIEALGHRMCWRYTPAANQFRGSTHTFNRTTLLNFARAVLARWGQPAHSGEPVGEVVWAAGVPNSIREVHLKKWDLPIGTKLYTTPPAVAVEPVGWMNAGGASSVETRSSIRTRLRKQTARCVTAALHHPAATQPQAGAVPLTDEQIKDEASHHGFIGSTEMLVKFVRGIEAAHGIKGGQHGPI